MFLNIIIPSYRASATIEKTLRSIFDCDFPSSDFDVTVVDSSDDSTPEIVSSKFPQVTLIKLPQRTFPGAARNVGIQSTKGDILCFIDADALAERDWLKNIHRFLAEHPEASAVGGPIINANPDEGWSRLAHMCEFSGYGLRAPETHRRVVPTVNLAIYRAIFDKFGPFIEDQFGNEDVLLLYRMYQSGEKLYFNHSIKVRHINKTSLEAIYAHQRKLGQSTGRARTIYKLPGSFLTSPATHFMIPLIKTSLIKLRLLTQEPSEFPYFVRHWPKVFKAMTEFSKGFQEGILEAKGCKYE